MMAEVAIKLLTLGIFFFANGHGMLPYQSVAHVTWVQTHALRASWHSNIKAIGRTRPTDHWTDGHFRLWFKALQTPHSGLGIYPPYIIYPFFV
jgi:hypothetical protein